MNHKQILDRAIAAFWLEIARWHPGAKGDAPHPMSELHFKASCERAYEDWLSANQPFDEDEREAFRQRR